MRIPYSYIPCYDNYFKIKWLDTKTDDRLVKTNVSLEYMKKRVSIYVGIVWKNLCIISLKNANRKINDHNKHLQDNGLFRC